MMRRLWPFLVICLLMLMGFVQPPATVFAQGSANSPTPVPAAPLAVFTTYPSQVVGTGETVTLPLKLRVGAKPQVVQLSASTVPEGWTATFRGGGQIVQAVYVETTTDATVDLRLEPPADVKAGAYKFVVTAKGENDEAELPVTLTVQEKLPPKLSMSTDLPTLRDKPTASFRWDVNLKNEGSEDLNVSLSADATASFDISFSLNGKDVTDLPLAAGETKRISVQADPRSDIQGGSYPLNIVAQGGGTQASLGLTAEIAGQATLNVTTQDGRLSGQAYAGSAQPIKILVENTGSAPSNGIELSSSTPNGWTVTFDPKQIDQLTAGQQQEVTANVSPSDKAVAGDYMMTITARDKDGSSKSADFRITVLTSTLWGIVGVALIAVAVGVVGLAVMRFGRR